MVFWIFIISLLDWCKNSVKKNSIFPDFKSHSLPASKHFNNKLFISILIEVTKNPSKVHNQFIRFAATFPVSLKNFLIFFLNIIKRNTAKKKAIKTD